MLKFDIFGPKLNNVCFSTKLCVSKNFEVLILNMTIIFTITAKIDLNKTVLIPSLRVFNFAPDFAF